MDWKGGWGRWRKWYLMGGRGLPEKLLLLVVTKLQRDRVGP